jgi:putative tributyrin esterase
VATFMTTKLFPLAAWVTVALLTPADARAQALPVKTVAFASESVGRTMKYNIVLPAKYEQSTDRYPVLYLLHGLTSNYADWARMRVPEYAAAYELIVVMPDVGNTWYVNWAKSDEGQKNRWEDAIIKDLIGHVDATYRTIARREGRAINGLSMGGYGGLMLGLRHPDLFCSIGSHSGAIAFAKSVGERLKDGRGLPRPTREPSKEPNPRIGIEGFSSQAERSPKGQIFVTPEDAAAYDPFQLVLKVPRDKLPHIYLDCGTEDRLLASNQEFAKLLMEHKIPFTYGQSGGEHRPPYWAREVGLSMAVQYAIIRRSLAASHAAGSGAGGKE